MLAVAIAAAGPALAQQPFGFPSPGSGAVPTYNPSSAAVRQPVDSPNAQAQSTATGTRSSVPIFNPAYPNAPVGGYGLGGYGLGGYGPGGYGGYMQGAANVTVANGQYQLTTQQARIVQQQADREALRTRRAALQERDYERANWLRQIDPETIRERNVERALRQAMFDPPQYEISSGDAPNTLLADLQNAESLGLRLPSVPLDPRMLANISVTTGVTTEGVGMLKNLSHFDWPLVLRQGAFDTDRQQIQDLMRNAVAQVKGSGLTPDLVDAAKMAIDTLEGKMGTEAQTQQVTPTQYIEGMRYLRELKSALRVLQDPDAVNYFNGKYQARGATVAELVQNMASQGLRFAPAGPGDDPYYSALYRALVTEEYRLRETGAR
jgi:hypothetical protein